jgi:hypothetical protein
MLKRGDLGHDVGGGDRIICSCTSGNVNGSVSLSALKSCDIRMASSETISSALSIKLSRLAITFYKVQKKYKVKGGYNKKHTTTIKSYLDKRVVLP